MVALSLPLMSAIASTRFAATVLETLRTNKEHGRKPDSIRSLAKSMTRVKDGSPETYKRSLFKWLATSGPNPSRESRAIVAEALGLEAGSLDDEEADPAMQEAFVLFVDLMERLQTRKPEVPA